MTTEIYRYEFSSEIPPPDVEAALLLAIWGAEGLHGETRVRLDAAHVFDAERHACVIDAGTAVGQDVNRLFLNFLRRELGAEAFRVERIMSEP